MYDLPANTMLTFSANPMFDPVDMSALPLGSLSAEVKRFQASHSAHVAPESDALTFYFMNHAFHVLKSRFNDMQTLPPEMAEVAQMHIKSTNLVAKRLFCYSLIIALEEARFIPAQDAEFYSLLDNQYGKEFSDFAEKGFRQGGLSDFGNLDITCGEYARGMMSTFSFGRWQPGFGGKGWVPIAALASQCIHGSISFEGFADQAFSLCHNNGSMFNKGHLYSCYSGFIYDILDIQDSGQVPQWIASNPTSQYVSKELRRAHELMARFFPDEMTGPVDKALIRSSKEKREQKAAAISKHNAATWNQAPAMPKASPMAKQNNVLMSGLDAFKPPRR